MKNKNLNKVQVRTVAFFSRRIGVKYRVCCAFAFSLVELMISLIIVSVITAAFTPVLSKKIKNGTLSAGSEGGILIKCDSINTNCSACTKTQCVVCNYTCNPGQRVVTTSCTCAGCQKGYYCNGKTMRVCPQGTYCNATDCASCITCGSGTYATAPGATACTACSSKTANCATCDAASGVCLSCTAGHSLSASATCP